MTASDAGFDGALRPEHSLLLRCIRAHFGTAEPPSEAELEGIETGMLMAEAAEHGVIPLVNRQFERRGRGADIVRHALKGEAQRIVASNLLLGRELADLAAELEREQIPALAFKGPAQALHAYGDVGFRPFSDLDVLVRWADVGPTFEVLAGRGYDVPAFARSPERLRAFDYHVHCTHPLTTVIVEVHWHPVSNRFALGLDEEEYWERAVRLEIGGRSVAAMGREDTLLITCAHATKHHWDRLEWAVSVAAQAFASDGLDWTRVLRLAERGGIRRVVLTGLTLAEMLSGRALPAEIGAVVSSDPRARRLARAVLRTTLARSRDAAPSATEPLAAVWFHMLVRDNLRDGVRFLATPKASDRDVLPTDQPSLPMLVGARAYRLVRRHLVTQADRLRRWIARG